MNELYSLELFNNVIDIYRMKCWVKIQFYIKLASGKEEKVLLLKVGNGKEFTPKDRYILVGIDEKKHTIIPVNIVEIQEVIDLVKHVGLNKEYRKIFLDIDKIDVVTVGLCALSKNLSVLVGDKRREGLGNLIRLEIIKGKRIVPQRFCFSAITGIDQNTYIELDKFSYEDYHASHLLNEIKFYYKEKLVSCYVAEWISTDNEKCKLHCTPYGTSILKNTSNAGLISHNLNVFDFMELMYKTTGLEEISLERPEELKSVYRWYTVIIPIKYINIQREFGIGNIRFLNSFSEDTAPLREKIKDEEGLSRCYAKVYVNEYTFYNALVKAKAQINQALDFIVNLARDDSFFGNHGLSNEVIEKDISCFSAKPELEEWVYIVDSFNDQSITFNLECINNIPNLNITDGIITGLIGLEKFEIMLIKLAEHQDENTETLFNSLKWIRKAWDSTDKDDQIINSIIALEFVVSTEKNKPLLTKGYKKIIKKEIEAGIRRCCEMEGDVEELINKVHNKFDFVCSDTPFFVKLESLISRLNIPVSEEEINLIKIARKKRNDIVHGRASENLSLKNIRILCEVISLITFYKLNSLEVE